MDEGYVSYQDDGDECHGAGAEAGALLFYTNFA